MGANTRNQAKNASISTSIEKNIYRPARTGKSNHKKTEYTDLCKYLLRFCPCSLLQDFCEHGAFWCGKRFPEDSRTLPGGPQGQLSSSSTTEHDRTYPNSIRRVTSSSSCPWLGRALSHRTAAEPLFTTDTEPVPEATAVTWTVTAIPAPASTSS